MEVCEIVVKWRSRLNEKRVGESFVNG